MNSLPYESKLKHVIWRSSTKLKKKKPQNGWFLYSINLETVCSIDHVRIFTFIVTSLEMVVHKSLSFCIWCLIDHTLTIYFKWSVFDHFSWRHRKLLWNWISSKQFVYASIWLILKISGVPISWIDFLCELYPRG